MSFLSKIFASDIVLNTVRIIEFAVSVIILGMIGYTDSTFNHEKTNFGVAVGAISTFYLLFLFLSIFAINKYIVSANIAFWENGIMLLWFCAFIVLAKEWGSGSCSSESSNARKCRTAQASIAFSGVNFILFLWTAVCFNVSILAYIMKKGTKKTDIFKTNDTIGGEYSKFHGCTFSLDPYSKSEVQKDLEVGPVSADEDVHSSESAPSNGEEPKENEPVV